MVVGKRSDAESGKRTNRTSVDEISKQGTKFRDSFYISFVFRKPLFRISAGLIFKGEGQDEKNEEMKLVFSGAM